MIAYQPLFAETLELPGLQAAELERRYEAYRRRQATRLVHMLPRAAIRPMVRSARAAGFASVDEDPLETLVEFCKELLPLPPFDVWQKDLTEHPREHLRDLAAAPEAPTAAAPSTVAARTFEVAGVPWSAELKSFRDATGWCGFICFREPAAHGLHRTAVIFRELDPSDLRDRFLSFENASLEAFLRSALP